VESVLALATAIEFRAGDTEAATRHQDSLMNLPNARLAAAYRMTVEGSRLKFKKKDLAPHQSAFTEGLAGPATAAELTALIEALDQYRREPAPYRGLKTHEKKILDRMAAVASAADMTEADLVGLGLALHALKLWRPLRAIGEQGEVRFHRNAYFLFFIAEAMVARQRSEYVNYRAGDLYRSAKSQMDRARDDRYRKLQELLDERMRETPDVERWINDRWGW
jgi:hypothetical protein